MNALTSAAARLLKDNGLEQADATVYFQITRGSAPRSHRFPPAGTPPTCYVEAKSFSPPTEVRQTGAAAVTVSDQRWARCDIKTIGLLANTLAQQQAHEDGAYEAIFSRDGVLLEGSHSSMLFVQDGVLIFPPLTNYVLPGITRSVVQSLATAESIPTTTRSCYEHELSEFQEILMLGTTVEIVPITTVNGRKVGDGAPGPIARKLQAAFRKLEHAQRCRLSAA